MIKLKTKPMILSLKQTANKNIQKILEKIKPGAFCYSDTRIHGCCPIPHDSHTPNDNVSAFSWLVEPGVWTCFTHHCEQKFGNDIFGLIRAYFDFKSSDSFNAAFNKLQELLGHKGEWLLPEIGPKSHKLYSKENIEQEVSLDLIDKLETSDYLQIKRGFKKETVASFKVGYCRQQNTIGYKRIIFPIFDIDVRLIGFSCRATEKELMPKWIHCKDYTKPWSSFKNDNSLKMSKVLYNIHDAKNHLSDQSVVLVEGALDVMRCYEAGINNVVALCGLAMTQYKRKLLRRLAIQEIKVLLDNDTAGKEAALKLKEKCDRYFTVSILNTEAKDPGEESLDKLRLLI